MKKRGHKVGRLRIRLEHRFPIKHTASGKRFAHLLVDDGNGTNELIVIHDAVDIDVSLEHCAVDSDGQEMDDPRHLEHELK